MASLSSEDVKNVYRCENKEKRRELLIKALSYPEFDEEEDMRPSILLDFYLESLNFASEQGLTWQQGLRLFELMNELRENALDLPLLEAIELFKTRLNSCGTRTIFQPERITSVVDFVFSLFFNHFHLYKFVFNCERESVTTSYCLSIETPPQDLPALTEGVEESKWDCQQVLKNVEEEHHKRNMERQLVFDLEIQRLESLLNKKLAMLNGNKCLSTDELKSIVKETTEMYVASAGLTIKFLIEESQENLMCQYSKVAANATNRVQRTGTLHSPNGLSLKKR